MAVLKIKPNDLVPVKEYLLGPETMIIGRHPNCEIVLDYGAISREHARITSADDNYYIEDLKSRNGTFLNSNLIDRITPIFDGDLIRICDIELLFVNHDSVGTDPHREKQRLQTAESTRNVLVDDNPDSSASIQVKSSIPLDPKRPAINAANAEAKLRALIEIGRNLGASTAEVLPQLLTNLLKIFQQADCAYILLVDQKTNRLELRSFKHRGPQSNESFRISRTVLEKVAHTKAAILSDDVANDARFDPSESIVNFHIYSIMAAPILNVEKNEVLGVIQVDSRSGSHKFTYDDLDLLVSVAYQVAVAYENSLLHEVLINEKVIEREMNVAHKVQRGFLPHSAPAVEQYEFYDFYQPARYLGGDYYDYIPLPDGRLAVALGDVSGKGVSAALLMANLSAEVRYGLLIEPTFGDAMQRINRAYCEPRWDDRFVTFILAILDPAKHTVRFHNAGHIQPILCTPGEKARILDEDDYTRLPLGILRETEYPQFEIKLEPGQKFVLLSDGLTDAMNSKEESFSLTSVIQTLSDNSDRSTFEIGRNLMSTIKSFSGKASQTDDQCLVICGRKG